MSSKVSGDSVLLKAKCHCGAFNEEYSIPRKYLPLKSAICGCDSCRRVTAQLWSSWAVIPKDAIKLSDGSKPGEDKDWTKRKIGSGDWSQYRFSKNLVSNFCSTCGASIANFEPSEWEFATGILSVDWNGAGPNGMPSGNLNEGLIDRQCLFVKDAKDGGGFVWLPKTNSAGREMKRHLTHRDSEVVDADIVAKEFANVNSSAANGQQPENDETCDASCHCGTVKFFITRPDPQEPRPARPVPGQRRNGKWWLADPKDPDCKKYHACLDACTSCRYVTGFEVNAWAFFPPYNVIAVDDLTSKSNKRRLDPDDPKLNLTHYESTPGKVCRSFCSKCGAQILCRLYSRDVEIFDIGIGLLQGRGSRCEEWVEWQGLEFAEDAVDPTFVKDIAGKMDHALPYSG